MFYSGFDALFSILFPLVFLVVLGMILFTVVSNLRTWSKNNASPRLTVPATVVAKRMNVSRHHTDNTMARTFTTYYVTFQVESGDRMELEVDCLCLNDCIVMESCTSFFYFRHIWKIR